MSKNINNKLIFVSGAGGSIGSEICRQILNLAPKTIIPLIILNICSIKFMKN